MSAMRNGDQLEPPEVNSLAGAWELLFGDLADPTTSAISATSE